MGEETKKLKTAMVKEGDLIMHKYHALWTVDKVVYKITPEGQRYRIVDLSLNEEKDSFVEDLEVDQ